MRPSRNNTKTLGSHLRTARLKAGLTTREVAGQVGITHSYLVKLETDQNDHPSPDLLQRLANLLGLDADLLLRRFSGLNPSRSLPAPRVYFRRKLGVSAHDADVLARLIEDYQQQMGNHDHNQT